MPLPYSYPSCKDPAQNVLILSTTHTNQHHNLTSPVHTFTTSPKYSYFHNLVLVIFFMHIPKLMAKLHFVTEQNKKPFSHVQRLQIGIQFD
ncbi:hypothetical protein HBI04_037010 [Parastagonospora nodorum]|nr:hypothetical protein HBI03_119640 [Parastagonospora nodorum]KAH4281324.1 hypothetical protein HBI04_037010 [Parastagonospora nodorum]